MAKLTTARSCNTVDVLILLKRPKRSLEACRMGGYDAPHCETDCIESAKAYHYYY